MHPLNILLISIILDDSSNWNKDNDFIEAHPWNIEFILMTEDVLNFDTSIYDKEEQSLNIDSILITL